MTASLHNEGFDWNLLRSFLCVFDSGSFSAASRRLNVSQPTLGRHITLLEEALGATLFERGREGATPTSDAEAIAAEARAIAESADAIATKAQGRAASVEGTVRITASEIVSTYLLPPLIAALLEKWPKIEIELAPSNEVQNLLRRDADIAIRMVRPAQLDLIARKVNEMAIGMFAHNDYIARRGVPREPNDLQGHIIIGYDRSDLILRGFREAGMKIDRHFFRFRCDDQVAAWEAVCLGVGAGFGPLFMAGQRSDLQRINLGFTIPPLPMWLVTHREMRTSALIRTVYDELAAALAGLQLGETAAG